MPYITKVRRLEIKRPENVGDLAYRIAREIETYRVLNGDKFQTFAEIDGAVNAALREFKRKVVDPYEDAKMIENGPVFIKVRRP